MEFNKAYNREEFLSFLKQDFLPEDFITSNESVDFYTTPIFSQSATKLGTCDSLDLVVYEVRHNSKHDARVGLSKEAFRMLAEEFQNRALVVFVPVDDNSNYRFSFIEISLECTKDSPKVNRKYSNPRRYSYVLGQGISYYTPNKYLNIQGRVKNNDDLRQRFSVEVLTKAFYQELSDWYAWAIKIVKFPNDIKDTEDDSKYNTESAIRLITRLIFVWFLKQRHLIPNEFFDEQYIAENLLKDFSPNLQTGLFAQKSNESKYYKAILQNLFFAMLNSPIAPDGKDTLTGRRFRNGRSDFDNNKLMRYESLFSNPQLFVELANKTVPFLNGGLFDCLDDKENGLYYDGFSDQEKVQNQLLVHDYLFFGEEVGKEIDLSEYYGDANKKKVRARGIIDILKRYNFTVEENTPFDMDVSLDPELLGKVFENLLASYNPETQTTARKQTGSFYTPREIVQYMVDESIINHLNQTVGKELEVEYRKLVQYTDEEINLTQEQKVKIMRSLYDCKILDPACGSGAFPMGILQQMVHILSRIDQDNSMWKDIMLNNAIKETSDAYKNESSEDREEVIRDINRSFDANVNGPDYARKLYLIERCIYGVDIQPIAIQISKLRFFISLIVDQKTNDDPINNFGIRPLPNLEAKFVAANSLLGLKKTEATLFDDAEISKLEDEMKNAKHKIFGAKTYRTKWKYKEKVASLRQKIADRLLANNYINNESARQLSQWDMFDQNSSSPFFDPEWMFGIKDGFDIVIGNPPYIQLQANDGTLGKMYEHAGFETYARTGDIYSLFYEKGFLLLKQHGNLCYITSNKWMRAAYGEKTRKLFAEKTNPKVLIDFAGINVFESATVDTNIILFAKENNAKNTMCAVTGKNGKECVKNLSDFVQQESVVCDFSSSDSWVILSPIEQSIKRKIESVGTPLKDWDIQINYGIKTGFNDAFIISTEKRNEILDNCSSAAERLRTAELIRPILRGRDIKRYGYDWANLWLVNTHNGIKGVKPRIEIDDYPAVKAHLDQHWDKISKRADKGDTPYNLRNCAYLDDFFKPKIVYPNMTKYLPFVYDDMNHLTNQKCFIITGVCVAFLTAFFNSSLFKFCFRDSFPELQGGTRELSKIFFDKIPVIKVSEMEEQQFKELLLDIQQEYTKAKAMAIDSIIFNLYDLSEEERKLIGFVEIE